MSPRARRRTRVPLLLTAFFSLIVWAAPGQTLAMLKHEYVNVNGVRLHYVTTGTGSLILFLHGFPEFWYAWKNQFTEFGIDHLAVAPDLLGYNLSDKPPELNRYEYSQLLEDIRQLGEHFSANRKFVLVGHDWGGVLAWRFAIAHPDRLERLVIINAPHPRVFARLLTSDPAQRSASQYVFTNRSPQAERTLAENRYELLVNRIVDPLLKTGTFTEEDKAAYLEAWSQPGGAHRWVELLAFELLRSPDARAGHASERITRPQRQAGGAVHRESSNTGDLGRAGHWSAEAES